MSAPADPRIFNPAPDEQGQEFSLFPLLPKELRLEIWLHAMRERRRFLQLRIDSRDNGQVAQDVQSDFATDERYWALVRGEKVHSKFLRVNQESRHEAQRYYRVHLPCIFTKRGNFSIVLKSQHMSAGKLYLNPEDDILYLEAGWPTRDTLINFLYHLKVRYDPRHIGIRNLALEHNFQMNTTELTTPGEFSELDIAERTAFGEVVSELNEVYFTSTPSAGRQVAGIMSGLATSEVFFNRSFPVFLNSSSFERHGRDPRPISHDLQRVLTGTFDGRDMVENWNRFLMAWNIAPLHTEYRFLLAYDPERTGFAKKTLTRKVAKNFIDEDEEQWRKTQDRFVGEQIEEDSKAKVQTAFGFWLFPLEALGPMHGVRRVKPILDMSAFWPELCVFSM